MRACIYRYDPLDRLAHIAQDQGARRYFYQALRRVSEMAADRQLSFLHTGQQGLAVHEQSAAGTNSTLIAPDRQDSVLAGLSSRQRLDLSYCPYGHQGKASALPGFNGEFPEGPTGHYLLGNGYRAFNPVLMRFNSPDSLSPFGAGGLNAYAYCAGDPLNLSDGSGHMFRPVVPLPGTYRSSYTNQPVSSVKQPGQVAARRRLVFLPSDPGKEAEVGKPISPTQKIDPRAIDEAGRDFLVSRLRAKKTPDLSKIESKIFKFYSSEEGPSHVTFDVIRQEGRSLNDYPRFLKAFRTPPERKVLHDFFEHAKFFVGGESPMNDIHMLGGGNNRTTMSHVRKPGHDLEKIGKRIAAHLKAIREGKPQGILPVPDFRFLSW